MKKNMFRRQSGPGPATWGGVLVDILEGGRGKGGKDGGLTNNTAIGGPEDTLI
jgi:hypothetical protein